MKNTPDPETAQKRAYESVVSVKGYLVDTSARILFYVPAIGVWEKFVAGMENDEVLKSRVLGREQLPAQKAGR